MLTDAHLLRHGRPATLRVARDPGTNPVSLHFSLQSPLRRGNSPASVFVSMPKETMRPWKVQVVCSKIDSQYESDFACGFSCALRFEVRGPNGEAADFFTANTEGLGRSGCCAFRSASHTF